MPYTLGRGLARKNAHPNYLRHRLRPYPVLYCLQARKCPSKFFISSSLNLRLQPQALSAGEYPESSGRWTKLPQNLPCRKPGHTLLLTVTLSGLYCSYCLLHDLFALGFFASLSKIKNPNIISFFIFCAKYIYVRPYYGPYTTHIILRYVRLLNIRLLL